MTVIGIVGLPGSGKSEAANVAAEMGVPVVTMGDVIREESDSALEALETIDAPESQSMDYLRDLAEFVVVREK